MTVLDFNTAKPSHLNDPDRRSVSADDIHARLAADPRGFVGWLFSGRAICSRHEARIADTSGAAGESLCIQLTGKDAGLWYDHATGEGGDLISLYMAYRGYDRGRNFDLALKEIARDFFNDPVVIDKAPSWKPSVKEQITEKRRTLGDKPKDENVALGAPVESYGYYDRDNKVMAVVRRYEPGGTDELGKPNKTFRASPGFPNPRPLYRIPQILQATHVVLTEGERKADALASVGIEATTAMGGANTKTEMVDWSPLAGKIVTIWPDKDGAGQAYAERVAPILLNLGCRVGMITPPSDKPAKWDASDCIKEGDDPHALINEAKAITIAELPQTHSRTKLYTLDELRDLQPPEWLIDGILTEGGMSLVWSGSDSFKTFVVIDMGMCVATGSDWHGHKVKQGLVVYIAAEDESGVKMRMLGWRATRGTGLPKEQMLIHRDGVTLVSDEGDNLIRVIESLPTKPVLVIIDTMARTFGAANENQTQDMNAYVNVADRLRASTGANIMIVHHSGRDAARERGNLALRGACNTIIHVSRKNDRIQLVNKSPQGKQKNAEPFPDIALRMQKVAFDHNGSEHTTLLVMPDDQPVQSEKSADDHKLGKIEKQILACLSEADQPLGFIRIKAITKANDGSIQRALGSLFDKNLIAEKQDGNRKMWELIQ